MTDIEPIAPIVDYGPGWHGTPDEDEPADIAVFLDEQSSDGDTVAKIWLMGQKDGWSIGAELTYGDLVALHERIGELLDTTPPMPTTETGRSFADGQNDDLTRMIIQIEREARAQVGLPRTPSTT